MKYYDMYTACAVQSDVKFVEKRSDIDENLARCIDLIDTAHSAAGTAGYDYEAWAPVKLISFSEFCFQGHSAAWSLDHVLNEVAVTIPGDLTDQLAERARQHKVFISAHLLEIDPEWEGYFFNTQFLIDDKGDIVLKYRKIMEANHLTLGTSPHDVYDRYVAKYGDSLETFFPVADTSIGKIGFATCNDRRYPETFRGLGVRGAEVIISPNFLDPFMSPPLELWQAMNQVRAFENVCYLVAPSWAKITGSKRPKYVAPGKSMIVNYHGMVLGYAPHPGELIVSATINLEELRRRRTDPSRNHVSLLRNEIFRKIYEETIYPPNQFVDGAPKSQKERESRGVLKDFFTRGIYKYPEKRPEYLKEEK